MDEKELYRYWKSRIFAIKLLNYRGFTIEDEEISFEDFLEAHIEEEINELKDNILSSNVYGDEGSQIMVSWEKQPKVGTSLPDIVKRMEELEVTDAIIISDGGVTPNGKKDIKSLKGEGIKIWVWKLSETMLFAPEHVLVPEHIICTKKEKNNVLKRYGITPQQMPSILTTDIMVRYLGASKGDMLRIIRPSVTHKGDYNISYSMVT